MPEELGNWRRNKWLFARHEWYLLGNERSRRILEMVKKKGRSLLKPALDNDWMGVPAPC